MTITAPMVIADDYMYTLMWNRALSPAAPGDFGTLSGATAINVTLDVVSNTPPSLVMPASVTLEGNTTGGATASYSVSATDAEDAAPPTPVCSPAVGEFVAIGTTMVDCTVTDSGGMSASGSFPLTVVDTTPPVLSGMPGGLVLATSDPRGAVLAYDLPQASDIVDPDPDVVCSPAPGDLAPVGPSLVTCTATDEYGGSTSASFAVTVQLWTAAWEQPIGAGGFSANAGRTVPIKLRLFLDGTEVTSGTPILQLSRCDGSGAPVETALEWGNGNGRWNGHVDTGRLGATGCHRIAIVVDGVQVASVDMNVVGSLAAAKNPTRGNPR